MVSCKQREKFQAVVYNIPEDVTTHTLWRDQKPTTYLCELGAKSFKIIQTESASTKDRSGGKKANSSNAKSKKKDQQSSSKAPNKSNKLKKLLGQNKKDSNMSDNSKKKAKSGNNSNKKYSRIVYVFVPQFIGKGTCPFNFLCVFFFTQCICLAISGRACSTGFFMLLKPNFKTDHISKVLGVIWANGVYNNF
ncbi:hypothetical protein C1646_676383 [Rhizophagus diaphanus]|nr:hypothetical protein C1646_676383 [Rhizophagus diaphanus] [Rhizophagus sp. MUCL 43196]